MNYFLSSLALLFSTISLYSQPLGFNKRVSGSFPNTTIYKLLVENDTIVALGDGYSDSTLTKKGIVLMKFDTTGDLLDEKFIFDSIFSSTPLYLKWGSFVKTGDGGYIFNVIPFSFNSQTTIKVSHDFQIKFIDNYSILGDLDYQLCNILAIDDGYLIFGSVIKSDGFSDGLIRKFSPEGGAIWERRYGNNGSSEVVIDVEKYDDETFIVAIGKIISQNSARNAILKIDKEGNTILGWDSEPEPPTGYLRNILESGTGGILLYGMKLKTILPNGALLLKSTISKIDHNYNLLWSKEFGKEVSLVSEIMFYNFAETIDGNYVAAGRTSTVAINNGPTYARGWLMKFSPEGDSIWSRLDTSDIMPVSYLNRQRLGGVGVLSSGSIVAGGYVTKAEDNSSYIWLIKTTNDGCIDTLYCGLVSATEEEVPLAAVQQVSVFPNPASNQITIQFKDETNKTSVSIFNVQGKLFLFEQLKCIDKQATLSIAELPTGLYFLKTQVDGQKPFYSKLKIVH